MNDIHVEDFAKMMMELEEHLPLSKCYDENYGQKNGMWWKSQREHMVDWFSKQNTLGKGKYKRIKPNESARYTYNHLNCPGAILWMAEALGEEETILKDAMLAASMEPNVRSRSKIVRAKISWTRICELLQKHS